ncbi:MAG: YgiT-type zinc finger protein [Lachnospiraceae bacterium]|nr:YgiT-type zinc finger protein [Lachnospiraceae bacterium]
MKCTNCGSKAIESTTTSVTDLGDCVVIVRNVPCYKCEECNEIIYTLEVTERLEQMIKQARQIMQGIAVMEYTEAA